MAHPARAPLPKVELVSTPAFATPDRVAVAERLLAAYQKAIAAEPHSAMRRSGEDMWSQLLRSELPDLFDAIANQDPANLADFLMNFGGEYVWFGGVTTCIDGYNKNLDPDQIALTYLDKLFCLAEALGVIELENPEAGPWGECLHSNIDALLQKIEEHLRISITPPLGVIHTDGLKTNKGVFHYRHINSLYAATRVQKLNVDLAPICEIGGGLGITALYARRLGVQDYTLLDLPISCLLAGHYLLNTLSPDEVSLFGEPLRKGTIKVLPYWAHTQLEDDEFALTINQDSLTEIADNLVMAFLSEIGRTTKNYFLSINHEYHAGKVVKDFVRKSGGFREIYRSRYWIREGYVEELFQIEKTR
jgi:hypothetical protein